MVNDVAAERSSVTATPARIKRLDWLDSDFRAMKSTSAKASIAPQNAPAGTAAQPALRPGAMTSLDLK